MLRANARVSLGMAGPRLSSFGQGAHKGRPYTGQGARLRAKREPAQEWLGALSDRVRE